MVALLICPILQYDSASKYSCFLAGRAVPFLCCVVVEANELPQYSSVTVCLCPLSV